VWDGEDVINMIGPLWGEPDEAKRISGYKAVAKHIAEEGEVIPLLQYVQPIIARIGISLVPQASGMLLPQTVTGA
jgi:peptide/nickel transport system substrate-binding protein